MPFVPGQSGNPSGRPKSKPITDELKRLGEAGAYTKVAAKLLELALEGNVKAIQEYISRVEGKLTDKIMVDSGTSDLISLLTKKAAQHAANARPADDTDIPGDAGNADDNQADA